MTLDNSDLPPPRRRRARRAPVDKSTRNRGRGWLLRAMGYGALVLFGFILGVGVSSSNKPVLNAEKSISTPTSVLPTVSLGSTRVTPTAEPPPDVAIVAGHYSRVQPGNVATIADPGAICPDGLREVDINLGVAEKTLALLSRAGYRTMLLEEFDQRFKDPLLGKTPDFRARVFLSIHSDSCVAGPDYPLATGWKVAHAEPSDVPGEDDRLVNCIKRGYDTAVKPYRLRYNEDTITQNMTAYHGFRSIIPSTPAAIIELGFMGRDRDVLVRRQDELARGIANGLQAFLQGEACR